MLETGVPNLDLILGGGIPEGTVLLLVGLPGSGKTTMAFQMAFRFAAAGHNVLYVSTLSEPPTKVMQHVRSYAFFDEKEIGKHLFLLSIYPLVKQSLSGVTDALIQAVREHEAKLVIIDGLMSVRDLHPQTPELRTFIYELGTTLPTLNVTTVATSSGGGDGEGRPFPEFTMADGVVVLGERDIDSQTVRTIRVFKMRGLNHFLGQHSMRMDGRGITVFPRIESMFRPQNIGLSGERESLGLPELDEMMHGGLVAGSVTLLAGTMGTGKTVTSLRYIIDGAKHGQKGMLVGFRETPQLLIDKARGFGMDLATPMKEGLVTIFHRSSVDMVTDEVTWELWQEVERFDPRRLALDSITELEQSIVDEKRRPGYMASLSGLLRGKRITTLITRDVPKVVGTELDFSDSPLAVLAENLILLRYVEFSGELFRILSILKVRDSAYDPSIRQYVITDEGMKVLPKIQSAEGLLTGIARLPSQGRARRRTSESRGEAS